MNNISQELIVLFSAMLPVIELRGAIPLAIEGFGMSLVSAFVISVIGNMIPVIAILWLFDPIAQFLRKRSKVMDRFFEWLFARTRSRFVQKHERWGEVALVIFVAIPLPVTGGWTGSLAASLFGIPKKRAVWLILLGVLCAGVIVSTITLGAGYTVRFIHELFTR